jgi:hypothetical protein
MRHNYFFIKMAGCLLIGSAIIVSVVFPTFFTFILGCMAWLIVLTSMIYNEIKIRKRAEVLKYRHYLTQSSQDSHDYLTADVLTWPRNPKGGLREDPVALLQEENFENSLSRV